MRRFTPFLLTALMAAFVGVVAMRRDTTAAASTPSKTIAPVASHVEAPPPAPPALSRPLRTVALGWELAAPGVVVKDTAFKTQGVDATFASAATIDDLESALAKGGADAAGADIAIMPLASFVASYERMRALSPEIVFVVGWSRGREAVYATSANALAHPSGSIKLAGAPSHPETVLALFMLDLAGVPLSHVDVVAPDASAPLSARMRSSKDAPKGKLVLTSADTPYLMPIVAVAPHGFVASHTRDLESWTHAWLDGVAALQADVPAGGRVVAAQTNAPPVMSIIEALGQVEFANLRENAVAVGLAGRGALTLDDSFRTTWRILREAGVLTTPPPEVAPIDPSAIAALARADRAVAERPARTPAASTSDHRPPVLLTVRGPATADADAWIARIGFVAAVFDRMQLRVSVKGNPKLAKQVVDAARGRFNLAADRVVAAPGASSTIEVRRVD